MTLHELRITCAPDVAPTAVRTYAWHSGDPVEELRSAISALQLYLDKQTKPVAIATTQDTKPL